MLTACYLLNRVPNKRNRITPYELWTKRKPNLNYLRVWGYRAVVRLPDPKLKTLGERGINASFVGMLSIHAFMVLFIEPNDSVAINSIIESRDAIFDENRFSSVPRPSLRILNGTEDIGGSVVPEEVTKEDDPKTFDEAMKSQDVAFWKEAINDEMDSIMGNNTWVLADLPPVIQGFKQKSGIDYFDTYAPMARISTKRLLIAMVSIHNMIIHQMDVKTDFLNGDLEEEQAPKQWHQKFDEVVLSNGYLLNQADKCVYSKFDETGKGVIICLYVDDMLIFGTDQSHYIEKVLKKFNYFECTPVSTPMDTSEKLMLIIVPIQSGITGSTIESKFVALAATGKEAKWLENLLLEILLWSKPIAHISIHRDSVATISIKAYCLREWGSYEKDITVGAAMILANVLVFTPKPSKHYLNITKRNVVEVFRKDTVSLA
ncbi:zinc finger, CCHC-type containing protein [Tanacetum coccineum]